VRLAKLNMLMTDMTDIPVFRGAPKPLLREAFLAKFVHGEDGLGDIGMPASRLEAKEPRAAEHIVSAVMNSPGEITLVALGPLTNIAIAICLEPNIVTRRSLKFGHKRQNLVSSSV
jgi:purine nucleosidase